MVLIPARSGSKRIPNKNIKPLNGKPLVFYSIESALQISNKVYVSTDSIAYRDLILSHYPIQVIIRPKELASDHSTDLDVIKHVVESVGPSQDEPIIYLRPTTPIRRKEVLETASLRYASGKFTSLRSIEPLPESSYKSFILKVDIIQPILGTLQDANQPDQLLPITYKGNGYIDIFNVSNVLQCDLFGDRCCGFVTDPVIELDNDTQWGYAEYAIKSISNHQ